MVNFKKFFIVSILFLFSFSVKSYAEIVKKIEVKGNERVSQETIIIFGDIIIDKDYQSSDIKLLIKKLYESNFFSNISVNLENGLLSISVAENPIVNEIILNGEITLTCKIS